LGGTAAYASLAARALGMRAGIVTSVPDQFDLLAPLAEIQMVRLSSDEPTTFENVYDSEGNRHQTLTGRARPISVAALPDEWRRAPVVHLAPIIDEVPPDLVTHFPTALLGITPQGWLRAWDDTGRIRPQPLTHPDKVLSAVTAVVLSIEDLGFDEKLSDEYAAQAHILVVTRGADGCSVHWGDGWRHFPAPTVSLVDPTGAGDIFAAAFFYRLHLTRDPHEAARFAVKIASASVTRPALDAIPTADDIQQAIHAPP
jgi:sugar/nucleoside kinase (ribokinase family)